MPSPIYPSFGSDDLVVKAPFHFTEDDLASILQPLAGATDQSAASAALADIAADYLCWRQQALSDVTQSQCNEQIRRILIALESLGDKPEKTAREIQTMIRGLSGEAFLALCATPPLSRRDDEYPWCVESLAANLPAVLEAAPQAIRARPGPKPGMALAITVSRLLDLYEHATGQAASHTPYSGDQYKGAPQSHAGQFASAFFKLIDPGGVRGTQLSTVLAREIKHRRSQAPAVEGANLLIEGG